MKYKIGDKVNVQRGFFVVTCTITRIDKELEYPYLVSGFQTEGRTSDRYILGIHEEKI